MQHQPYTGLVAATHTPFASDGTLNLAIVEKLHEHLLGQGLSAVFIGGTTGESHSMTTDERLRLAQQWTDVSRGTPMQVIVHVGSNCLADARVLATHAQQCKAAAIAALAPSYFKPRNVDVLADICSEIAGCAPATPFYYYDIPPLTGVTLPMPELLLKVGGRIKNFVGIKFSNPDLTMFQHCMHVADGKFDVLWGIDEYLLGALTLGGLGSVGSSFNFAAPMYHRLIKHFAAGDLASARVEQYRCVQVIELLASCGYMGAAKAVMGMLGVAVGPARLPNLNPSTEQLAALQTKLETLGFFDWVR